MYLSLWAISVYLALLYQAKAFNFTHNDPTSCDDFTVQWTSGSPPFYLTLVPVFGTPRNFSIPSDSFSDGKGSFSTQLPFPENRRFVAIMSDSTNYGSGGDTSDLQVGASKGGQCNTTDPGVDFLFQLNTALQQCRAFTFSNYDDAKQPITILGIIPSGDTFVLHPPTGPTFDWTANVWNGTRVMFLMFDSQGRQGGSSDILTVSATDNSSCIDASSPSTTASPSETSGSSDSHSGAPVGAIAGSVLGALVFLAVCITLGLFFLRRRRDRDRPEQRVQRHSRRVQSDVDLLGPPAEPYTYTPYPGDMTPAMNTPATQTFSHYGTVPVDPSVDYSHSSNITGHPGVSNSSYTQGAHEVTPFVQNSGSSQYSSSSQRKAAMAGVANNKQRFVLHTDMEDNVPEEEEEVIELPPQYSERRTTRASGSGTQEAGSVPTSPTGKRPPR
ncbi:hypothetical protein D9758_000350 [Tetrapyrgos nigripes]|uniref:Uncharacterized protein n=1 Tax=Tetrapyrgos nigripes TaxID=182062 RepID=A0A8H5LYK7_9AGAR|nr:hypothetical protein D9758_000350 [Tetrapyrgos nigripes]